jgi:hypothetical protein
MKSIKLHKRTKRNTKGTFKKLRNTRKNKILKGGDPDYLPLYVLYKDDQYDQYDLFKLDKWWSSFINSIQDSPQTISEKRKMILTELKNKKKVLKTLLKANETKSESITLSGSKEALQQQLNTSNQDYIYFDIISTKKEKEKEKEKEEKYKKRTIPTQLPNNYEAQIKNETLKKLLKIILNKPKHSEYSEATDNKFINCDFPKDMWEVLTYDNTLTYYCDDYELFKVITSGENNTFEVPENIEKILKNIFNIDTLNLKYNSFISQSY